MAVSKKQLKKDSIRTILFVVMTVAGLGCLLYPPTSDVINTLNETKVIRTYKKDVNKLSESSYDSIYEEAKEYNEKLSELDFPLTQADTISGYDEALDLNGDGVMGIVEIPKINVNLPIYHGTEKAVLGNSAGHIEGTSLPIGGMGTHSVIAAHRGATNARLFTDIDLLETGDTFSITTLGKKLTYKVDSIQVVLPEETSALKIESDKDYVTLQTCTPYGVNSHRLLVRGEHVSTADIVSLKNTDDDYIETTVSVAKVLTNKRNIVPILITFGIVIIFVGTRIYFNIKNRNDRGEKTNAE